jgi:chemotaxis protein MotB
MDRLHDQPKSLDDNLTSEQLNEQLRKENFILNQKLHKFQKVRDNFKLLIDQVERHKSQLQRAKTTIVNQKQLASKIIRKKDVMLKKYETILYGNDFAGEKKIPVLSIIDGLKTEVTGLGNENTNLNREKEFFKKEIEEMESKVLVMEEKEINNTKEFKPHAEARVAVTAEFSNGLESFLVTYSDLITLILVIFVLLYSVSKVDGGKFTEVFSSFQEKDIQLQNRNVRLSTKEFEMLKHVRELVKDNVDPESLVRSDVRTILIRLKSSDLFAPGSADLKEGAQELILNSIKNEMQDGVKQVHVDGHTDNVPMKDDGPFPTNWELSSVRASHVARVIIDRANFSPDRTVVTGYGEYRPLKPNNTDDNRALNRRVEIKILKDVKVEKNVKEIKSPKLQ